VSIGKELQKLWKKIQKWWDKLWKKRKHHPSPGTLTVEIEDG
jgi:hypothetical protein